MRTTAPRPAPSLGLTLGLIAALALAACAPRVRVTTSAAPGVDFARFATYAIVPPVDTRTALVERLDEEIAEELDGLGYRRVEVGQSDLLVVVQATAETSHRQVFADSPGGGCCVVQSYLAGTLVVEVFDAAGGKRLWRGVGEVDLASRAENEIDAAASHAAKAVLDEFPPHAHP